MKEIQLGAITVLFVIFVAAIVADPAKAGTTGITQADMAQSRFVSTKRVALGRTPVFNQLREPRAVLVYDSEREIHVVLGSKNRFYVDGRYYRTRNGVWQVSPDLTHWGPIKHSRVPFELRKQLALRGK